MSTSDRPTFLVHASIVVFDDTRKKILLVREQKPSAYNKWNLPGGHVEHREDLVAAAQRELREETHLTLPMQALLGVYRGPDSIRFVFTAEIASEYPRPGDEILEVRFFHPVEILQYPDADLVAPDMLRAILSDVQAQRSFPLIVLSQHRPK